MPANPRSVQRFPVGTTILAGTAVIAALMPAMSARLIDLRALTGSDPWRLFTGHLVHGNLTHLLLNLAFFMALGAWVVGCISIKTTFELAGGGWVLGPGVLEDSFGVLYLAGSHAAGIVGGLLLALVARSSSRRFPAQEKRPDSNGRVRNVEDGPDHCSAGSTRAPQPPRVLRSHASEGVNG